MVEIFYISEFDHATVAEIEALVTPQKTLETLLDRPIVEIVSQDEFSLDIVVEFVGSIFLAYDAT